MADELELIGEFEASGDGTTAANIRQSGSDSRNAVVEVVQPIAADIISSDATVIQAATAAAGPGVDAAIADRDLVNGADPRLPEVGDPAVFDVETRNGGKPFRVFPDFLMFGSAKGIPSKVFELLTRNGGLMLGAYPRRGEVRIPNLIVDKINGAAYGSTGGVKVQKVFIVDVALSQSKGLGRALPYGDRLDPPDPRILQYSWATGQLEVATTPLSAPVAATGLSAAMVFARELIRTQPPGTIVILVCGAVGDTGLVAETTNGVWRHDYAGTRPKLWPQAMAASQTAHDLAVVQYGLTPEHILFSDQGEADGASVARADYEAAFDANAADYRARWGASAVVLLAPLVSEWAAVNATRAGIRAARVDAPRRLLYSAYIGDVPNGGGSNRRLVDGAIVSDDVHGGREFIEKVGKLAVPAYEYALTNIAESSRTATTPQEVKALRVGTSLRLDWSQPFGRVDSYIPEYRMQGDASWSAIPHTGIDRRAEVTLPAAAPVEVRVTATNGNGPSAPSTPIYAQGA